MNRNKHLNLLTWLLIAAFLAACQSTPTQVIPATTPSQIVPTATPVPTVFTSPLPGPAVSPLYSPLAPTEAITVPVSGVPAQPAFSTSNAPLYTYQVIHAYPHDRMAFTQGLVFQDGILYESTGLYGSSTLRQVNLETGEVLRRYALPEQYFGEGIAIIGAQLFQLTWQSKVGFVYKKDTFESTRQFTYTTEGWGLTYDGVRLIMSDGTATLHWLDPQTLAETGQVQVSDGGVPVTQLNELEYINSEVWANVWQTEHIARINPQTGHVVGWIDLAGLLAPEDLAGDSGSTQPVDVLNGIAYDAATGRLFVTGKWWPKLFDIQVIPAR